MAEKVKFSELTKNELLNKLEDFQEEHRNLRFNKIVGQVSNSLRIRIVRRYIAKVKTILREIELGLRKER